MPVKGRLRVRKGCTQYRNKLCHPAQGQSAPRAISRPQLSLKVGDWARLKATARETLAHTDRWWASISVYFVLFCPRNRGHSLAVVMNEPEDQDLRDVMREEKSRGKRRIDVAEHRRRQELLKGFRDALDARTEREFLEAIKLLGLGDDPLKRENALKIWRSFSR
jgi:hypothetical protein